MNCTITWECSLIFIYIAIHISQWFNVEDILFQPSVWLDGYWLTTSPTVRNVSPFLFQFHSLAPMYYRGSAAAVIVYDITKLVRRNSNLPWNKNPDFIHRSFFFCLFKFLDAFDGLLVFVIQHRLNGDMLSVVNASLRLKFETGVKLTDFSIILGIKCHSSLVCSWKLFWPTHCKAMTLRQKLRRYFLYIESFPQLSGVSCCSGLFPDTEEVGEGAERTRPRGHCCSHSRKQEWFRRHQVSFLTVKTHIWWWWW